GTLLLRDQAQPQWHRHVIRSPLDQQGATVRLVRLHITGQQAVATGIVVADGDVPGDTITVKGNLNISLRGSIRSDLIAVYPSGERGCPTCRSGIQIAGAELDCPSVSSKQCGALASLLIRFKCGHGEALVLLTSHQVLRHFKHEAHISEGHIARCIICVTYRHDEAFVVRDKHNSFVEDKHEPRNAEDDNPSSWVSGRTAYHAVNRVHRSDGDATRDINLNITTDRRIGRSRH